MISNNVEQGVIKRDNSLDAVAGVLILYMITVHLFQLIGIYHDRVLWWMQFLNFYVPWFFFKAGSFFRGGQTNKDVIAVSAKKLIKPFVIYSIIGYLVYVVCIYVQGDRNWIHFVLTPIKSLLFTGSISGNPPLWFLLSLFVVRFLANLIISTFDKRGLIAIICFCFFCGWLFYYCHFTKPDYLLNITTGLGFFLSGYALKAEVYKSKIFVVSIILYLTFCLFLFSAVEMRHNILERGVYILWPITCLTGIISINNLFKFVPFKTTNPLVFVGKKSLHFLALHYPILYACKTLFNLI